MNNSLLGKYVTYKENIYLVVRINGERILLLSPNKGKVEVKMTSITTTNYKPARLVTNRGKDYLVTDKHLIISLTTWNVVHRDTSDGIRKEILSHL